MKKLYLASLLTVGLSISAFASQSVPRDRKGDTPDPHYAGVSACEISNSTGTAATLCATGEGIILDVFASSVATTDSIVLRDSNTANTSSTVLFAVDKNSLDKAQRVFPRFKNGLSANALVAPTSAGTTSRPNWVIIYSTNLY